jgi:CRP-like cAMP-binding protein
VTVAKGEVIYEENEKNDKLYLIETGEVLISKGPKNAQNDVLRTEKLHFGEDHFLQEDMLATETVTAKVDTVMGVLSTTSLIAVIRAIRRLDQSIQNGQLFGVSEARLSDLHRHRILGIGAFGRGKGFISTRKLCVALKYTI